MHVCSALVLTKPTKKYSKLKSTKVVFFFRRHAKSTFFMASYRITMYSFHNHNSSKYVCVFVCVSLCNIQIKAKEVKSYSGDYSNYGFRFLHISPRMDHWITGEFWRRKRELRERNTKVTIEVNGEKGWTDEGGKDQENHLKTGRRVKENKRGKSGKRVTKEERMPWRKI